MAKIRIRRETAWPLVLMGTILWCSGQPAEVPSGLFQADKIGHFALYGCLATSIARHPALGRWVWPRMGWAVVLASAYGLSDEIRQGFSGVRTPDWADWVADTFGAIVAVTLYARWAAYRRFMERPLKFRRSKAQVEIPGEDVPNSGTT